MKSKRKYINGEIVGNLKFVEELPSIRRDNLVIRFATFECSCGKLFNTRIVSVVTGNTTTCGCGRISNYIKSITKHGMTNSSEYSSWECIKGRCLNPHNKFYKQYGGRGIKICDRWLKFENFYADMGKKPSKEYSIDRINNDGDYTPENCRWTIRYNQDRNKTNSVYLYYNGDKYILSDLAKKFNMSHQTLKARVNRGIPVEIAVSKDYKYVRSDKYTKNELLS